MEHGVGTQESTCGVLTQWGLGLGWFHNFWSRFGYKNLGSQSEPVQ